MSDLTGLRVLVQGDLPADVMGRISAGVRAAVLSELAEIDIAPPIFEVPLHMAGKTTPPLGAGDEDLGSEDDAELALPGIPELLGIWFKTADDAGLDPGVAVIGEP